MLIWQFIGSGKDLFVDERQSLAPEEYLGLLKEFYNSVENSNSKVNTKLRETLDSFLENRVLNCSEKELRKGYIGLYRWCITESKRDEKAKAEARKLWSYFFGGLPQKTLAYPPATGGRLELDEGAWFLWIESMIQDPGSVEGEEFESAQCEKLYPEGWRLYRQHRRRERNSKLISDKKASVHSLKCEVCDFDFEKKYGDAGKGFAECHHIVPLAKIDGAVLSKLEDLAILCSNCHRIIHRNGVLSLDDLRGNLRC